MKKQARKDRDYPMLSAALKSLRHSEFAKFYSVLGRLQIGWGLFCSREEWNCFQTWLKPQIDDLYSRKISYKTFRDQLAEEVEQLSDPRTHEKIMVLVREAYNCKDRDELYKAGKRIFEIKGTSWTEVKWEKLAKEKKEKEDEK